MEEFDLEKYNTGDYDVVTRDGKNVRILCTDRKAESGYYIVALIEQEGTDSILAYKLNGRYNYYDIDEHDDLMLVKKQWQPKEGERFYTIATKNIENSTRDFGELGIVDYYYSSCDEDNNMISQNNCFKTKEEAEIKLNQILKILKQ